MAWPSTATDLTDPVTGQPAPAAWGDWVRDALLALHNAWTAYTPEWTGATSSPAIGNGALTGAYLLMGKTLFLRVHLVLGTTSTTGTGDWRLSLPAGITAKSGVEQAIVCHLLDPGASNYTAVARVGVLSGFYDKLAFGYLAANVSSAHPFAWGNGDSLVFTGLLETA